MKTFEEMKNMSEEEQKALFSDIDERRAKGKRTNFAATYNAGVVKITSLLDGNSALGRKLYNTYWERNWAIKEIVKNSKTKRVGKIIWLYNPVSRLWYYVTNEKDIFSTLNQSTGDYVFNTFLKHIIKLCKKYKIDYKQQLQYHDEALFLLRTEEVDLFVDTILPDAMKNTNEELKLNITIGYSVDVGNNYAECH